MSKIVFSCLIVIGLINFLPVIGILSAQRLENAYDIKLVSNDLIILMRHRALLFGILGGFIIYSAFVQSYQTVAMILAAISMVGFAVLVHLTGDANESLNKVLLIDYIGIVLLAIAAGIKLYIARH